MKNSVEKIRGDRIRVDLYVLQRSQSTRNGYRPTACAAASKHGRLTVIRKYLPLGMAALIALAGCSAKSHIINASGHLAPGKTVTVNNFNGDVAAYPPALGQSSDRYAVEATLTGAASQPSPIHIFTERSGLSIENRSSTPIKLLVRIPKGDNLVVRTKNGSLNISDLDGHANAQSQNGNIHIQMGGYANASTVNGNISATLGSTTWPGSLHFQALNGDVEVYVPAVVNAHVKATSLHGTVFTDFSIPAHADRSGLTESAEGNLGSGGRGIVILTHKGNVHLMKLVPQM